MTFCGDPASSRAVTWRTDATVNKAFAEISPATPGPEIAEQAIRIEATTQSVTLDDHSPHQIHASNYHSVIFKDLEPGVLYAYRVGDGKERWSEWFQFRTAEKEENPFCFLYFGDAQNDVLSRWSRVIRMAHRTAPDAAFAIHAGDLVNNAHADREWAEWMKAGGHLHAEVTGVPVVGNHEYRDSLVDGAKGAHIVSYQWRPQFTLPIEDGVHEELHETVYSFVYQGLQVIVLNSCRLIEEQIPFLKRKLQEGDYRWRIVTFHHPVFPPSRGFNLEDPPKTRQYWKPLFEEYDVDLVLQGHDHTYARGHTPQRTRSGAGAGTMYVTSVSGPKMYEIDQDGLDAFNRADGYVSEKQAENMQFFQVICIDGDRLEYRAYTATGELFDSVTIEKNEDGKRVFRKAQNNYSGD